MSLIVTNTTAAVLDLNDLGIGLDPSGQLDLSRESDAVIIANSATNGDLNQLITSGDLTLADPNDGVTVLSVADALAALQSHNDSHYRMPVGAKIGDAFDVDVTGALVGDTLTLDATNNWVATTHNRWEIIDDDGDTGITAESATGADEDQILVTVANNTMAVFESAGPHHVLQLTGSASTTPLIRLTQDGTNNSSISYVDGGINVSAHGSGLTDSLIVRDNGNHQLIPYENTRDDSNSVTPENFLYTGPDGTIYSAPVPFRAAIRLPQPVGNNTVDLLQALRLPVDIPHTGRYRIMWKTVTSINSINQDIVIRVQQDDTTDLAFYQIEHKDAAGVGIVVTNLAGGTFNSGTSQRVPYSDFEIIDLNAGFHNFDLDIAASLAGQEPTLYAATIIIERWDY